MPEPWVLAVDLGTGGPKTAAVGLGGEIHAMSFAAVPTVHTAEGGATQDVALWWSGVRDAVRRFVAEGAVHPASLHSVAVTGQFGSSVPVDRAGNPVGPCIMWSDRRGAQYSEETVGGPVAGFDPRVLLAGLRYAGGAPPPAGEGPQSNELYLRRDRPDVWERTSALLEPVDYLALRFAGRAAASPASMCVSFVVDTRPGHPRRYLPVLARRFHRDPSRLPRLHATGSVLGPLLPEVAEDLGVAPGAPVLCGVPDKHAAYLGSGAVRPFQGHLAISSTGWISSAVPFRKLDPLHMMTTIPGTDDSSYLIYCDQLAAGSSLHWWRSIGCRHGQDPESPPPYEDLLAEAVSVPAGSRGVFFLPWLHGELVPLNDSTVRAGFVNLSAHTDRATMTRAVLEGVALNTRHLLDTVERFQRRPMHSLRILGGGAQSALWCQIMADALGRPMEQVADPMAGQLRGVALLTRVALGELTMAEAAALVPVARTFTPRPEQQRIYDEAFEVFRSFYRGMRRPYRRLRR